MNRHEMAAESAPKDLPPVLVGVHLRELYFSRRRCEVHMNGCETIAATHAVKVQRFAHLHVSRCFMRMRSPRPVSNSRGGSVGTNLMSSASRPQGSRRLPTGRFFGSRYSDSENAR